MTNRPPEIGLPPEPGEESPFEDAPLLDVHGRIPFVLGEAEVDVDGQAEVTFGTGSVPGTAAAKLLVRVPIATADDAAVCDRVLHGSLSLYAEREAGRGTKVQRTEFPATLQWSACESSDTGPVGEPVQFSAEITSLTLSATEGGCVLTIGLKLTVAIPALARLTGLSRARCRLVGRASQQALPLEM